MAKSNLPIEVHDHFQKANLLHGYFLDGIQNNIPYAIETGIELLAAKAAIPHGSWVSECERLFDGSLRNAQFYMQLAKHMEAIPKAQKSALLFLETTLEGAAKAAKAAACGEAPPKQDPPPEDEHEPDPEPDDEPVVEDEEQEDTEPDGDPEDDIVPLRPKKGGKSGGNSQPITAKTGRAAEIWEAQQVMKTWVDAVGRWMNGNPAGIDVYLVKFPCANGNKSLAAARDLLNALEAWRKCLK